MKGIYFTILALGLCLCSLEGNSQRLMDMKVKKLSGDSLSLSSLQGKNLLFYVLPLNAADTAYKQLVAFCARYKDTVGIVGILSREDGYTAAQKANVLSLYAQLSVVVLEETNSRKGSAGQSALLQWLTSKEKNYHYNTDVAGVGHKFFVDKTARLYAVFPPQLSLQSPVIDRVVHAKRSAPEHTSQH